MTRAVAELLAPINAYGQLEKQLSAFIYVHLPFIGAQVT